MLLTNERFSAAKRRVSRHGAAALASMLLPAILFPLALFAARNVPRFQWLHDPTRYPWELWAIALSGCAATVGGILDWQFHRSGLTAVGAHEHRAHIAALAGGGVPLFALMCIASVTARPSMLLLPILIVAIATIVMICYDEFRFHRRCGVFESRTHRLLTIGNGIAWLAWMHWCFVRAN
jgi:hypothetical protein